jgi:hypothetical protein
MLGGCGDAEKAAGPPSFNFEVQPILAANCLACHGPDLRTNKAGLRLDTFAGATARLEESEGHAIVPGKPEHSGMISRILAEDAEDVMPPPETGKRLTAAEKDILRRWIAAGATYERHWSLNPPKPAEAKDASGWSRNGIDPFILGRLAKAGLRPNGEADKPALIRRVSLALTGLPPTPDEVAAFVADRSEQAYGRVVDRLLASEAHAEHFARHWLDGARYADTHGIHIDNYRSIWPYRDWVIAAFRENKRWDAFTVEQVAGDLMPGAGVDEKVATGFNRCLATTGEGGAIPEEYLAIYAKDRVDTVATLWLGLTMGCASCHDHKYDPISQRDFYRFAAFFRNTSMSGLDGNDANHPPNLMVPLPADRARLAELDQAAEGLRARLAAAGAPKDGGQEGAEARAIRAELAKVDAEREAIRKRGVITLVMDERPEAPSAHVLDRGEYASKGEKVGAGTPPALHPFPEDAPRNRLGLARWLVDPANPLMARVTMNRLWHNLFGAGIVETVEDLGVTGAPPSHPELLDWLALEFRRTGWDHRAMARTMVMSAAFRQSAKVDARKLEADPANRLLSRGPRHRLDAEVIRDQALAASGLLVRKVGGPSVRPYQPEGIWEAVAMKESDTRLYKADTGEGLWRRSLYTFWKRTAHLASLDILNAPSREACTVRRERTNTPLQALVTLNDPQFVEAARVLAERALAEGRDVDSRLDAVTLRLLARRFDARERAVAREVLEAALARYRADPKAAAALVAVGAKPAAHADKAELAAWTLVASKILNLDEALSL